MDELTPSLTLLLEAFRPAFRAEVFAMFRLIVPAWILCQGQRTISRIWETTGQATTRNHAAAYRFFSQAVWNWDEVCRILLFLVLERLVVGTQVWIAVDDTLCHKRGAQVAFGGIFLDPVLSSKKHKNFRFGHNWILLTLIVQFPFRPDRPYALPIYWRLYEKKTPANQSEHQTKAQRAAEMLRWIARQLPEHEIYVVADQAYVCQHLFQDRPKNVHLIGPIRWDASLRRPAETGSGSAKTKLSPALQKPRAFLEDGRRKSQRLCFEFPNQSKTLDVRVMEQVCWPQAAGQEKLKIVLLRDPAGLWRDEALVCTDLDLDIQTIVSGYCQRWSIEIAFHDAKQHLGFHQQRVWSERSVQRAAPMAWLIQSLTFLWYAESGQERKRISRERPWYRSPRGVSFSEMLWTLRADLLEHWLSNSTSEAELLRKQHWLVVYFATAA